MLVGYLGPKGSFSHQVALKAFPEAHLEPYPNITEVIKAYERGQVDLSIVPVENSIEGSVHETLDYLFHQAQIQAVAELIQPIKQQLLACQTDGPIETIFSHPQALAQSKIYILEHYPNTKLEITASTAAAARLVAEHPEEPYAAIAPETAAEEYGLQLVARDIQEMSENFTRFWVLGCKRPEFALEKLAPKKTLGLTLPDNLPGALYKALSVFAWRGIDLTKIESRPLKTALGEYFFIIDVNGEQESLLQFALEELTAIGITYKILGQYSVHLIA
ncbi:MULTISPECIES: prephenate dehydratase [Streptococcus]|uniref:prephenate dehydratase n=1 Tax=Streptococcus TaxID=1301 RepID=UPI00077917F4|nr:MULTISPECIES: prephenate dehydratase [Streptococcus]MCB6405586.1 prephenate dehydratase [Streptococcus gordonii]MDN5019963.1 prephenate dehydratase [Streptococcus sp. SG2]RSJ34077.1 P-protein [Streptococcus gordonii]RSJ36062.1 P-protein [Streptococcus gordonii]